MREIDQIYRRFQRENQSFEVTLRIIEQVLNSRLQPQWRRLMVQASNSGLCRFCIIVFPEGHGRYQMLFHNMNIRQWRPSNSDNELINEIDNIERIVEELRQRILSDVIKNY